MKNERTQAEKNILIENNKNEEKQKSESKTDNFMSTLKRRKKDDKLKNIEINGHHLHTSQFTIRNVCENCSRTISMLEKAYLCKDCKLTICKTCTQYEASCMTPKFDEKTSQTEKIKGQKSPPLKDRCPGPKLIKLKKLYTLPLTDLTNENIRAPTVMLRIISFVEWNFLHRVPGFYRKAPQMQQKNQLKEKLNKDPLLKNIKLEDWANEPHVLSSCLKDFFFENYRNLC